MANPAGILVDDNHLFSAEAATDSSSLAESDKDAVLISRLLELVDIACNVAQ